MISVHSSPFGLYCSLPVSKYKSAMCKQEHVVRPLSCRHNQIVSLTSHHYWKSSWLNQLSCVLCFMLGFSVMVKLSVPLLYLGYTYCSVIMCMCLEGLCPKYLYYVGWDIKPYILTLIISNIHFCGADTEN